MSQKAFKKLNSLVRLFCLNIAIVIIFSVCSGCDYARMKEQPSIRPYETVMPEMPPETIPTTGGLQPLQEMDPEEIQNPVTFSSESLNRGKEKYGYFCIMCHGPKADGYGTVGQSFYPLPTNLKEPFVQELTDGELFYVISFGLNRHPPLAYTISERDRWDIINFLRSLSTEQS
jgi:mono/diheme cytochrome c family protein